MQIRPQETVWLHCGREGRATMTSTSERKPSLTINDCSTNFKKFYKNNSVCTMFCIVVVSTYLLQWFFCLPFESFIIRIVMNDTPT